MISFFSHKQKNNKLSYLYQPINHQVEAGCASDDTAAHDLCRRLQRTFTDTTDATTSSQFRALDGGPRIMEDMNKISLHPSDTFSGKHLIQGVFREMDSDEDFSLMTEKDAAKIKKQKEKAERAQRAAFEAHQQAAAAVLAGEKIEVVRNVGGPAVRDIHLTRISVGNGGAELIEDADIVLAYGRKYGLVGRNGTGKSTFLRALAGRQLAGLPSNCQVLHVEQEIVGDEISVLDAVLQTDVERTRLLQEEAHLMAQLSLDTRTAIADAAVVSEEGDVVVSESSLETKGAAAASASLHGGVAVSCSNIGFRVMNGGDEKGDGDKGVVDEKGNGNKSGGVTDRVHVHEGDIETKDAAAPLPGSAPSHLPSSLHDTVIYANAVATDMTITATAMNHGAHNGLHVDDTSVAPHTQVTNPTQKISTTTPTTTDKPKMIPQIDNKSTIYQNLEHIARRLHEIDAYAAEARAASILAGLSFDPEMQRKPTSALSGGWRMRVALARALFVQPDLLLLDEPTNHLDLHAVLWLQEYLEKWPKTVIVVSHAREFLNAVCTDVLHLHNRTLTSYKGNYATFEKTAAERLRNARAAAEAIAAKRAHIQAFIDKFRYNANRAALVQSRIKALERMAEVADVEKDPEYSFSFPTPPDPVSAPVISFTDVAFAYHGQNELYHDLNFGIDTQSRFAIVGGNGAGKSTLLNLVAGVLQSTRGHVYRNPKLRLAVFSQHHVDGLDLALTPLQYIAQCFPEAKDPQHRSHLASFGVTAELAAQQMYTLSGGQKSRVAFAKVTWCKPHILLLDEPSNHLDMEAVDALIEGLMAFGGGVVMVSHDQHLIEATVDELWAVEGGTVKKFYGTFEDYKKRLRAIV